MLFISKKGNRYTALGSARKEVRIYRFVFKGWRNRHLQEQFHNSVGFLFEEHQHGRCAPPPPWTLDNIYMQPQSPGLTNGDQAGDILEMLILSSQGEELEKAEKFFMELGIQLERADPFISQPESLMSRFKKWLLNLERN